MILNYSMNKIVVDINQIKSTKDYEDILSLITLNISRNSITANFTMTDLVSAISDKKNISIIYYRDSNNIFERIWMDANTIEFNF